MANFVLLTVNLAGHLNPTLQFAKRLIREGAHVTFLTTVYAHRNIIKCPAPAGLTYATFSDGYDDGPKPDDDQAQKAEQYKERGKEALADLLRNLAEEGRPVTCVIYTLLLQWAADVARTVGTQSALLWLQPATVFGAYYYCFHGYGDLMVKSAEEGPRTPIKLPGLPLLTSQDLPSFVLPTDPNSNIDPALIKSVCASFSEQFVTLDKEERPVILVNTFDAAEPEAIKAVDAVDLIGVGPLVPPGLLYGQDRTEEEGVELCKYSRKYIDWLDSKPASSVVYVSFGSFLVLPNNPTVEILNGLLESGRPFLWVHRSTHHEAKTEEEKEFWKRATEAEEMKQGMVVPWCSQAEVLSHPSVGCFVSHCGWNSTTESLVAGVPMVCLPHWSDQATNAKMVADIWNGGVRAEANGEGVFEAEELKRCLDLVMDGEAGGEIRKNAVRWRELAREAVREGGSSHQNIRAFVERMKREDGP